MLEISPLAVKLGVSRTAA